MSWLKIYSLSYSQDSFPLKQLSDFLILFLFLVFISTVPRGMLLAQTSCASSVLVLFSLVLNSNTAHQWWLFLFQVQ